MKKKIKSLAAPPGGTQQYMNSIINMLEWVSVNNSQSSLDFDNWCVDTFHIGLERAVQLRQTLGRLGLIEKQDKGLCLSDLGHSIFTIPYEDSKHLVLNILLAKYLGLAEVLSVFLDTENSLHLSTVMTLLKSKFPHWESITHFEERCRWLVALGALQQVGKRQYIVTELGINSSSKYLVAAMPQNFSTLEALIHELHETARDSTRSSRFERANDKAYRYLGLDVISDGKRGKTDSEVSARVGDIVRFHFISDAKTSHTGKVTNDHIDFVALEEHIDRYKAKLIIVGEEFAGGRVLSTAIKLNIGLLTIDVLVTLLRLHKSYVLSFELQKLVFEQTGLITLKPEFIELAKNESERPILLIDEIIKLLSKPDKNNPQKKLSIEQNIAVLGHQTFDYDDQEVRNAVMALAYYKIVIQDAEGRFQLDMNREMIQTKFRKLSQLPS